MARPRSAAHRSALLAAAARVIATQGLSASTATIAKEATVSAGTLFVYFETKADLVNELYVTLKTEMATVVVTGISENAKPRDQLQLMWDNWIGWATADPNRQRALAHLSISEDLTSESHQAVNGAYSGIVDHLRRIIGGGPMQNVRLGFVTALMSAIADATINDLIEDPDLSGTRSSLAFEAMWRALAG